MNWNRFQRLALTAFIAVEVLIFVGAVVRVTGSGLGCPDWPFCYGCWFPPTKAQDIDFTKIDLEKFRSKAAHHGRDPASISIETLRAEFDPVATWVEYINRLTSLPVGVSVLALFIASIGQLRQKRPQIFLASVMVFALVIVNAWLGARVVLSGLKPGTITLHMALAIALQCVLVYTAWRGTDTPWRMSLPETQVKMLRCIAMTLLALVIVEGIMGSQVREMTDQLAMKHSGSNRVTWTAELENSMVYLIHRSFSWLIVGCGLWFGFKVRGVLGRWRWLEFSIVSLVMAQMTLGVLLARVGISQAVQVLHIGLSSLLVSSITLWVLASGRGEAGIRTSYR